MLRGLRSSQYSYCKIKFKTKYQPSSSDLIHAYLKAEVAHWRSSERNTQEDIRLGAFVGDDTEALDVSVRSVDDRRQRLTTAHGRSRRKDCEECGKTSHFSECTKEALPECVSLNTGLAKAFRCTLRNLNFADCMDRVG